MNTKKNIFKRIIALMLAVVMSCSGVVSALAETMPDGYIPESVMTDETVQDAGSTPEEPSDSPPVVSENQELPPDEAQPPEGFLGTDTLCFGTHEGIHCCFRSLKF